MEQGACLSSWASRLSSREHSLIPWWRLLLEQDLLWRYHVAKEHKQERVNEGELPPSDAGLKRRQQRMVMGITGTLIPAATPRCLPPDSGLHLHSASIEDRSLLRSSSSQRVLHGAPEASELPLTLRRSSSRARSRTGSSLSSSSSLSSIGSLRLQEMIASQVQDTASSQLRDVRRALEEETRRREAADRKIQLLCERLGLGDDAGQ